MYVLNVCMQMHLCESRKNISIKTEPCLKEMFCCSWGLNSIKIFFKNKTVVQMLWFFFCFVIHWTDVVSFLWQSFVVFYTTWLYDVCQQTMRKANAFKTSVASCLKSSWCLLSGPSSKGINMQVSVDKVWVTKTDKWNLFFKTSSYTHIDNNRCTSSLVLSTEVLQQPVWDMITF